VSVRVPDPRRIEVIDDATAAALRALTPAERFALVGQAHRTARRLVEAGVRHRYPGWTDEAVGREVARRMSGGAT
jgi:hypothetical protein